MHVIGHDHPVEFIEFVFPVRLRRWSLQPCGRRANPSATWDRHGRDQGRDLWPRRRVRVWGKDRLAAASDVNPRDAKSGRGRRHRGGNAAVVSGIRASKQTLSEKTDAAGRPTESAFSTSPTENRAARRSSSAGSIQTGTPRRLLERPTRWPTRAGRRMASPSHSPCL